jgi:AcrR family transcriptional regulator
LNAGEARELIIEAAETRFAAEGYDAVSFRDLTAAAGVSLSAIHYHFGSKEAVLSEIFSRRAGLMTKRRVDLLEAARRYEGHAPSLESILDAFLRPAFEVTHGDRNELFNRLRARLSLEHSAVTREIVRRAFDENDLLFIDALRVALPELTQEDLHWRFHFLVGAMIYTMSDSGQLEGLSGGSCASTQTEVALVALVKTFASLFRSPSLHRRGPEDNFGRQAAGSPTSAVAAPATRVRKPRGPGGSESPEIRTAEHQGTSGRAGRHAIVPRNKALAVDDEGLDDAGPAKPDVATIRRPKPNKSQP